MKIHYRGEARYLWVSTKIPFHELRAQLIVILQIQNPATVKISFKDYEGDKIVILEER